MPEIAYLTIDEANHLGYGEILNGNKLTKMERATARKNGSFLRNDNDIISISLKQN